MPSARLRAKPKLSFEAIGTHWEIDLPPDIAAKVRQEITAAIHARIDEFDRHYSRFRADSLVSAMAVRAGEYRLPVDAKPLLDLYRDLYRATDGAMTPLIGQVLDDAGYDANYSFKPQPLTPAPSWDATLEYDFPRLTLKHPALLDFGAAGKGYLVDLVAEIIEAHGVVSYCVDAGGDIRYRHPDHQPLKVGLEHPENPRQVIGVAQLAGGSLCGSAGNRRAWDKFHHIIHPQALASPRHIRAVWAMADTTLLADALTTALFFTSPEALRKHYSFDYAIIYNDYSLSASPKFPASFFAA